MRKSKEYKRTKEQAGLSYKRGEKTEAYKQWAEAAKGIREWKAKKAEKKKKKG